MSEIKIYEDMINGIYIKRFAPNSASGAAVILSHGYNAPHTSVSDAALFFAEAGLNAVTFDFKGGSVGSKSEGTPLDMSISGELEDIKTVYEYTLALNGVSKEKIFLYGESQGGYVSALFAAQNGTACAGAALLYPAFCIPDNFKGADLETFELMGMTLSRKFLQGLPSEDIFETLKRIACPVLIAHGEEDGLVDISYSERALKSLKNAELVRYKNEGHGFSQEPRADWLKRALKFFRSL